MEQQQRRVGVKQASRQTAQSLRRRHEDESVSIRKARREETLAKRRNISGVLHHDQDDGEDDDDDVCAEEIPTLAAAVLGTDSSKYLRATRRLRLLLSMEDNPPIDQVVQTGVVPRLVQFLSVKEPNLQMEAAWTLTNVVSGNSQQTAIVVQSGAIPVFIQLINTPNGNLCDQVLWALGNIAGDGSVLRDTLLRSGVVAPLQAVVSARASYPLAVTRNAAWLLSNLCRGKPSPNATLVAPALPAMATLCSEPDVAARADVLWGLSYLSDAGETCVQLLVQSGVCAALVPMLADSETNVVMPALRCLGNIVTGTDVQTQAALDAGLLPALARLLRNPKQSVRKEASWVSANVSAGTQQQVNALVQAGLVPLLVGQMNATKFELRTEACWAVCNAIVGATEDDVRYIMTQDCVPPMMDFLTCSDVKLVAVLLEALETALALGEVMAQRSNGTNPYVKLVEEASGVDALNALQDHHNEGVYTKAVCILEDYFGGVEDGDETGDDEDEDDSDATEEDTPLKSAANKQQQQQVTGFTFAAPPPAPGTLFTFGAQ
eukprot:TRINITY_DN3015_c0_g1_i10.p1 TRINITY_DN3015_c0_g1~~TRINITY_DN3015_c0_g1_i10.p1  ORF type:complete len:556 (-),score=155.87 TRINITY_DN3015_c0_g1_i10:866-2512(-)